MSRALLTRATERVDAILRDVVALVEVETSSYDKAALDRGLDHVDGLLHEHLGDTSESRRHDGGDKGDVLTATYAGSGGGHVSLLAHYDTVWPTGTLAGWPVTT